MIVKGIIIRGPQMHEETEIDGELHQRDYFPVKVLAKPCCGEVFSSYSELGRTTIEEIDWLIKRDRAKTLAASSCHFLRKRPCPKCGKEFKDDLEGMEFTDNVEKYRDNIPEGFVVVMGAE